MKKLLLTSVALLTLAGCANTQNADGVTRADIEALRSEISAANSSAQKAYKAAQQANLAAQDAKSMSLQTDEKLNRMFKKAQMK